MPSPAPAAPFLLQDWRVEPALDRLSRGDESIKLDPRNMQVLVHLAARAGEVVTQEELEQVVWKDVVVGPNSVYQSIAQLRRALGDDKREPQYIATIPRKGYRLVARVTPTGRDAGATADETADVTTPAPAGNVRTPNRGWRIALVALLAIAGLVFLLLPDSLRSRFLPADSHVRSIAVLPLLDLSPERSSDYLADGITEEILNSLSLMPELKVAARTSAFAFKGKNEDVRNIGRALDVRYVLEGSVRRVKSRIRVTAQLVNTVDGYHVWSKSYDRPFGDLLAIESDIAHEVANALRVVLSERSGARLDQAAAADIGAYELFLIGQHLWQQRTPDTIARALPYLQRAIETDPEFAPAYASLAQAHLSEYFYAGLYLDQARDKMLPLIERALELNPSLPEALGARGLLYTEMLDFSRAEADLTRAIEINPNYAYARLWLGMTMFYQARPREALSHFERANDLDPLFFQHPNWIATALTALGRHEESLKFSAKAQELGKFHPNTYWPLAITQVERGRPDLAEAAWAAALERAPAFTDLAVEMGITQLDQRKIDAAQASFALAKERQPKDDAARLSPAWGWIARGDRAALRALLDSLGKETANDAWLSADLGLLEAFAERPSAAIAHYERALALPIGPTVVYRGFYASRWRRMHVVTLAAAYRDTGDAARAAVLADQALKDIEKLKAAGVAWHGVDYLHASVLAVQGQRAGSLASLRAAVDKGWRRTWWARQDPAFAKLRTDGEFVAILRDAESRVSGKQG